MLSLLTIRKSALKRLEPLRRWIEKWGSEIGRSVETLDLEVWSVRGHAHDKGEENIDGLWIPKLRPGTFIWSPSTGVDIIDIDELHQARKKRTDSAHFLIVPRLL